MKGAAALVSILLLTAVLLLSSCAQSVLETPPMSAEEPTISASTIETPSVLTTTTPPETSLPPSETRGPALTTTPSPTLTTTPPPTTPPVATPTVTAAPVSTWTRWGPVTFGNDYAATPGTRIDCMLLGTRQDADGKTVAGMRLTAVGLSGEKEYALWAKGLSDTVPSQMTPVELTTLADGSVVNRATNDPISLELSSYAKGEALSIALMTADKSVIAYGKVILFPIEVKQGRARVWVELLSTSGDMFAVYGAGFEANEEIAVTSNSEGEVIRTSVKCDSQGRFTIVVLPAVVGKASGQASYTVTAKVGTLAVSFDWGPPAMRRY